MTTAAFKAARKPPARAVARLQAPLRVARRPIVKTATAAALPVARLRGRGRPAPPARKVKARPKVATLAARNAPALAVRRKPQASSAALPLVWRWAL